MDTVVGLLPGGSVINTVLSGASKGMDTLQWFTNNWVNDKDRKTLNSMNKTSDKIGNFLNSGPLEFAANKILDNQNSIFGNALN